jgi:hypothetical protein
MESGDVANEFFVQEIAGPRSWPRVGRLDGIRHNPAKKAIQHP